MWSRKRVHAVWLRWNGDGFEYAGAIEKPAMNESVEIKDWEDEFKF